MAYKKKITKSEKWRLERLTLDLNSALFRMIDRRGDKIDPESKEDPATCIYNGLMWLNRAIELSSSENDDSK